MSVKFIVEREFWMDFSVCRGEDPSIFVLDKGQTSAKARKLCERCPVKDPCYDYGLRTGSVGVWGGQVLQFKSDNVIELFPLQEIADSRPIAVNEPERIKRPFVLGQKVSGFRRASGIF